MPTWSRSWVEILAVHVWEETAPSYFQGTVSRLTKKETVSYATRFLLYKEFL